MTKEVANRNSFWDAVRGVLMLIVVFAHAIQRCNGMDPTNPLHLVIQKFQMEALMFVSGYVAAYSTRFDWKKFLRGKSTRLLVPYLAWVIPVWLILVITHKVPFSGMSFAHELVCSNFWFLRTLFLIFLCFGVFKLIEKRSAVVGALVYFAGAYGVSLVWGQGLTFHYALFFAAGYAIHKLVPIGLRGGGNLCLNWVGTHSLAIYAVHWNLLFAYFPYRDLHLIWLYDNPLNIYLRAAILFVMWMVVTVGIIIGWERICKR